MRTMSTSPGIRNSSTIYERIKPVATRLSSQPSVQDSVSDMLKVVTTAIDKMREQQAAAIKELAEERKELAKVTELHKDYVAEYDRLTERVSTQIRALIVVIEKVNNP